MNVMSRAASRVEETGTAIEELLWATRSPERATLTSSARAAQQEATTRIPAKDRIHYLLDAVSVQRLFQSLDGDQLVSRAVAAAYCDCAILTLERRLSAKHGKPPNGWRHVLFKKRPPGCDARGYLRWSFVLALQATWDQERHQAKAPYRPKVAAGPRLLAALTRRFRFLRHADGSIESAWGQGGLTVARFIAILDAGGTLALMTPMDVLALPWANAAARAPWEAAVAALLDESQSVVAQGAALTRALEIEEIVGNSSRPTRRSGF